MGAPRPVASLGRGELAVLAREHLLAGQLMDRAGMPHLISAWGREEMAAIAVDEWMGASPVYTRRTQQLLGLDGHDVETLFKGLQLDIGAPPEFMDFRLRVDDAHHGEFWLDHCGALMDVEPMGDDFVRSMCHDIEDPTFDATAMATSPYARVRPVHRPPRTPADRHPHCRWTVTIDESRPPLPLPAPAERVGRSLLAALPVAEVCPDPDEPGWHDYRAPLDPDLRLERFSRAALVGLVAEIGVQAHLLAVSFMAAVEARHGRGAAVSVGVRQLEGVAGLTSERLRDAFGLDRSPAALAQVLEWHPLLQPRSYVDATVRLDTGADPAEGAVELEVAPCPATDEPELTGWWRLLAEDVDGAGAALDALVRGVDPHYRCERLPRPDGGPWRWVVRRDEQAAPESRHVALTRFSTGATFEFSETPVELR